MLKQGRHSFRHGDERILSMPMLIYFILFFMGVWGCLAIYNATCMHESPFFYAGRQFLWLMIGLGVLFISSRIPFEFYRNNIMILAAVFYIPLILVLFMGVKINGMRGWFEAGGVFIQPSELGKAPFVLLLSIIAFSTENKLKSFLMMSACTALWLIPVILEPDLGTGCVYIAAFFAVYWLSGGKIRHMLYATPPIILLIACYIIKHQYVLKRISGFLDPQADPLRNGWHICQLQYTLARGGPWGETWGKAFWSNSYLPLSHSDSAFATLTESVGFAGALPIIIAVVLIVLVTFRMAAKCGDGMSAVFIMGTALTFMAQAMLHISVNVTLLPPTGITLPMLSYGGSSLVSTMFAFGIVLSSYSKSLKSKL